MHNSSVLPAVGFDLHAVCVCLCVVCERPHVGLVAAAGG